MHEHSSRLFEKQQLPPRADGSFSGRRIASNMPRASVTVELLTAKLEASELRQRVTELNAVITQLQAELHESNTLLRKQRLPPRIRVSSTERQKIAARQGWRCASEECPLRIINPPEGLFDEGLFEIDHVERWSDSARHTGNLAARCAYCHSKKTRRECDARFE